MPAKPQRFTSLFPAIEVGLLLVMLAAGPLQAKDGGGGSGGSGSGSSGSGGSGGGGSGSSGGGGSGSGSSGGAGTSGASGTGGSGESGRSSGGGSGGSPGSGSGEGGAAGSESASASSGSGERSGPRLGSGWADRGPAHRDQDVARDSVMKGAAVPLSRLLPTVRQVVGGNVLDVNVRRLPTGTLVYDVTVLSPRGEYVSVVVDARRNRIIGMEQR